jgi:hypothetical protein
MFRIYSPAKVIRLLAESDGHFTTRLGFADAAWMPHPPGDPFAPAISGPADSVTYTLLDGDRVEVDVVRGNHVLAFAPPSQHGVGPAPAAPAAGPARKLHRILWAAMAWYIGMTGGGFAVGYGSHRSPWLAGMIGAAIGYLAAYLVNLGIVVAVHSSKAIGREQNR